jgi:DNA-binding NarL/FixJ family response regulator
MGRAPTDEAWSVLRAGDAAAARRAFEAALADNDSGEVREGLATALYLEHMYVEAADQYELAFSAFRAAHDYMAAGRAARTAAWIRGSVLGEWAVQSGWLARARTVFAEAGENQPEYGWVLIIESFSEPDPDVREALLRRAMEIGRRFHDPDIENEALAYLASVYILTDRAEQGLVLFDEALAAACTGEMTDLAAVDSMFCGFYWACELLNDVPRADQWMRAAAGLMSQRNVVAAFCRAHYGGILTAAGRWPEAEAELVKAAQRFERGISARREAALIRLADLRIRQGRLEEAAQLLVGLEHHPDAVRAVAFLHLARGQTAVARDLLERATEGPDDAVPQAGLAAATMIGPLLGLLVEVQLAEEDVDAAGRTALRLQRLADAQHGPYLIAAAALAQGLVCAATDQRDARARLHRAMEGFALAQLPMERARARLEMARSFAEGSPELAVVEAKGALADFERLGAARYADAAGALLRSLGARVRTGAKGVGALTKRETEVLALLGAGLSNPEIADRLYITRKTVETHVGNLLSKLGLRNRAEAAAFAVREGIQP